MNKVTIYYIWDDYWTSFSNLSDQEVSRILYQMNNERLVKIEDDDDITYYNSDNITAIEVEKEEEEIENKFNTSTVWRIWMIVLFVWCYIWAAFKYNLRPFN